MATGRANERDSIPMPAPTAWPMLIGPFSFERCFDDIVISNSSAMARSMIVLARSTGTG